MGTNCDYIKSYCENHSYSRADCAHFVSCCIGNSGGGGLPVPGVYPGVYGKVGVEDLATWVLGNGGVEKYSVNDLEMGDVIWFKWNGGTNNHIVIYLGNGKVASHSPCVGPTTDWTWFKTCSTPMTVEKFIHINTADLLKSDLIVQNLAVNPNHGLPGSNATISFTIYNQGSGTANASTTRIRIRGSTGNPTYTDPLLATLSIPSIPAGGSYNINQSVIIPTSSPPGTNYVWVILDVDSTADQSDEDNDYASKVFTVDNSCTLPTVTTNSVTEITSTSAKLNATINPNGQYTEAGFFYGTNPDSLTTFTTFKYVGNGYTNVPFYQTKTSLLPNTIYYYQVYAEVSCGGVDGEIRNFRTITSPTITTSFPLFSGTQNQFYSASFSATGGTTPYTWSKTSGTFPSGLSLSSSGVLSGTPTNYGDFNFTIQVMDSGARTGSKSFALHINQAGVSSTYPPQVTTNNDSNITSTSAQLNGNLDSNGNLSCQVWFEYGKTTSYGSSTSKQSKSSTGLFNQAISSLDSNTTYHFRACASNTEGTVYGQDKDFTAHFIGDFNGDCQVNFPDLIIFALAYNTTPGDPKWNSVCDLNKDGIINFPDLIIFAMAYGDVCAD